jgi:hypothetical protein
MSADAGAFGTSAKPCSGRPFLRIRGPMRLDNLDLPHQNKGTEVTQVLYGKQDNCC